jgi:hypothetical protein
MGAQGNADIAQAYAKGLSYINTQSPYFKQYSFPVIEQGDPYLTGVDVAQ